MRDTIVALSSGRPPAAIGVVRVSGPAAFEAVRALAGTLPAPREARVRALRDGTGALLDRALVLIFPGPASATGEDLAELHCHGGRAVLAAVEAALIAQRGMRAAEPGEFTRRALGNGRIDLAEAEGLADLLSAETEVQRRAALNTAEGAVSRKVQGWLERLAALAARCEVAIDYDEEDSVGDDPALREDALALAGELRAALASPPVERLRDGVRVVLAGPPNSGKSTLINALAGRQVAITSPIAGTTRDRIEAAVQREGLPFELSDTAGLTETDDPIEAAGVALTQAAIVGSDLLLWLGDGAPPAEVAVVRVHARIDAPGRERVPPGSFPVSALTGEGVAALWEVIASEARALLPGPDQIALHARHWALIGRAEQALSALCEIGDPLLVAEQLRVAHRALAEVTGANATETMLDALFSRFCLGK